jgi:hypothetical protein
MKPINISEIKNNLMKIDKFKVGFPERHVCDICNAITEDIGSIRISTRDPKKRYRGSNRALIGNYKFRLCEKCFKEIEKRLDYIIYGDPKKDKN